MKSGKPLGVEENNDFLIGSMTRESSGKEARFETKGELDGGEVREEACRSPAEVSRGGVDQVRERERVCKGMAGRMIIAKQTSLL